MSATYPAQRRAFDVTESWPGSPMFSDVGRAIADWQNYTYNSDLSISPCDAKAFGETAFAWQSSWSAGDMSPSPQRYSDATRALFGATFLGSCYMPPPRIPTSGVRVWFWVLLSSSSAVGTVEVRSESTQVIYTSAVTYAACGSVLTGAWISVDAEAQPGDVLSFWVRWTAGVGTTLTVDAVSGYHLPSTLWGAAFAPISQAHITDDRPISSAAVRWLLSTCNRFQAQRAALQFFASYLGDWMGYASGAVRVGKYQTLKGEGVTSIRVEVYTKRGSGSFTGTPTLLVKFNGTTVHTFTVTNTGYGWLAQSIAVTGGTASSVIDVDLEWGQESNSAVFVPSVSFWEETATVSCAGAETVPGAFVANDNDAMIGKSTITQAQWRRMAENQFWIWKNRGLKSLICDSRFTSNLYAVDHDSPGADHESQGIRRFRFADAAGVPRFYPHWHGWYGTSNGWAWVDETAQKAAGATLTRAQWTTQDAACVTLNTSTPSVMQAARALNRFSSPPWTTASAQTQDYEVWVNRGTQSPPFAATRLSGLIVEQMPLNQAAGTRA